MSFDFPRIGVVTLIFNEKEEVLLGKRKSAHAQGMFSAPGGHLEKWEAVKDCARREVLEETGLEVKEELVFCTHTDDFHFSEQKHYVTLYYACQLKGEINPINKEPEKCEGWDFYSLDNLPSPLFPNTLDVLMQMKEGLSRD